MTKQHYPLTTIVDDHLYPRDEASSFLGGVSVPTLRRMEKQGILKPIRLNKRSPTAQVYYSGRNIRDAQSDK
jgi:DNA-binding transcriptional MerR regulator